MLGLLLTANALGSEPPSAAPVPDPLPTPGQSATWIGTQSVVGSRSIPLLGTVEFRTDTRVLAVATRVDETTLTLDQHVCSVSFSRALGAEIRLDPTAPRVMAPAAITFTRAPTGNWTTTPWPTGWDAQDHDHDGSPGITFHVAAPICGGSIAVASAARNEATGTPGPMSGRIKVWVEQQILDTTGACLRVMARDRKEWLEGRYRYVGAAPTVTCDLVTEGSWPDPWLPGP